MTRDPSGLDLFGYLDYLAEQCNCRPDSDLQCSTCDERGRISRQLGEAVFAFRRQNGLDWLAPSKYEQAAEIPY